jgi:hypothetical protein
VTTASSDLDPAIRPFEVYVPQRDLDDLAGRLGQTRWPHADLDPGWVRGVPLDYLRGLVERWTSLGCRTASPGQAEREIRALLG